MDVPLTYLPIGILGAFRWLSWMFRRMVASRYTTFEGAVPETTLSVVTPVYQEDPRTFIKALKSWLANPTVNEVICVIDVTDLVCWQIANSLSAVDSRIQLVSTDVPGKRDALRKGWEHATGKIVALVDSDTIWANDVGAEVLKPFADRRIGAVATRQSVFEPSSVWEYLTDFYLDYRYFDEVAAQTAWGRAISCVSGRTAVYRRWVLLDISEEFMAETFWGVPCNSGDDKRLTTLALERGHRTYLQRSARVWSTFPSDYRVFMKQRLRWARNTWRSDLRALMNGWVFRHRFLAFVLIDKAISPFTTLLAPVFFLIAVIRADYLVVGVILVWWLVSRGIKNWAHLRENPGAVLLLPAFVLVSFLMAGIRIQALLTIRTQRWLTRDVAVVDGELMRTAEEELGDIDLVLSNPSPTSKPIAKPPAISKPPELSAVSGATAPTKVRIPVAKTPRSDPMVVEMKK